MSWPMQSIWQTQTPNQAGAAQAPAVNMGMYQLSAEQQYALQQQNWQQWQVYQNQLAQWQAQYGEQVNCDKIIIQDLRPYSRMNNFFLLVSTDAK